MNAFEAAIGGVKNTAAAPQTGGFRTINWDGVKLDGTDFGGGANTTVINTNKTVGIPLNRFQGQGTFFEEVYAVSGDGFTDVNPNVTAALFPAFSPTNTFAMFNDNTIDQSFVLPSATGTTPALAGTRGFGAIFINNQVANTSSIEYFHGDLSLGKFFVPVSGTQGEPEFLGVLFNNPIVTNVTLTLGTDTLFTFNGTTATGTGTDRRPQPGRHRRLRLRRAGLDPRRHPDPARAQRDRRTRWPRPLPPSARAFTGIGRHVLRRHGRDRPASSRPRSTGATATSPTARCTPTPRADSTSSGTNTFGAAVSDPGRQVHDPGLRRPRDRPRRGQRDPGRPGGHHDHAARSRPAPSSPVRPSPSPRRSRPRRARRPTTALSSSRTGACPWGPPRVDSTGKATFTTTKLPLGSHNLTAVFLGTRDFNTSTSTAVNAVVRADVTSQLAITLGRIQRKGRRFVQHVTIVNNGGTLRGPLVLVLSNLTSGTKLYNASGTTTTVPSPGNPFIIIPLGTSGQLAGGASVGVDLILTARVPRRIHYKPIVLAGLSQP